MVDATMQKVLITMMEIMNEIMEQVTEQTEILKKIHSQLKTN